ncbi:MAG: hypothetical protein JO019_05035 [Candidatus Kaiserbacteria bacterium]|nr:hypothetical protein [Candidatus Kaiserbacteria bacterium]
MKKLLLLAIALIIIAGGVYFLAPKHIVTNTQPTTATETTVATSSLLEGTWQSTEDSKFTREFKADGSFTDSYAGDASAATVGTWNLFTSGNPDPGLHDALEPGATYLKMTDPNEVLFFSLLHIDDSDLQLSYLDRGNTLEFRRIK